LPRATPDAGEDPGTPLELPRLELVCLGPATARVAGRTAPADVLWRKHLALLIYLALSPTRSRSRNQVLGALWPEKNEARARHSLNEALHRLRASLGSARLQSQGETIALNPADLEVDVVRLESLAAARPSEAVALLRGDFLEGFAVEGAPGFEDWADAERARLRTVGATALIAHGERALAAGGFAAAREAGQRALALEPYSEAAVRLEIRAAALAGDSAAALKCHHQFAARLQQIGERPSRELEALAERVRTHGWQQRERAPAGDEPPLVGRTAATAEIERTITQRLLHGPCALLIAGDPGTGKTRLLNQCLERLALEGALAVSARLLGSDQDAPWSALRALMRGGLVGAPGLPAADPRALAVLAALVPELAERIQPQPPRDRGEVGGALASLLSAVADETPLALGLDQADWCDGATLGALRAALEQLGSAPVVLVLTSAGGEGPPSELVELQREIGRGIAGTVLRLAPLTREDLGELVTALAPWCSTERERSRLTRRLAFETGGNPFLAVTVLRGLQDLAVLRQDALEWPAPQATFESPLPIIVPDLVRRAIVARLVQLDPPTRAVLGAASIGDVTLDLELVGALTGVTGALLEDRLAVLERQRFLAFDAGRYAFAAPLVQQVVRAEGLTPGQVQSLRSRAVEALGGRPDLESRVLRAELQSRATPGARAFEEAVTVARAALAAQSRRTARRAILAAERAVAAEPGFDRLQLHELQALLQT
jgi:DNA-binding SARP family transcriptional activator